MIIYSSPDDKKKNRGFCFLEYDSHKVHLLEKIRDTWLKNIAGHMVKEYCGAYG